MQMHKQSNEEFVMFVNRGEVGSSQLGADYLRTHGLDYLDRLGNVIERLVWFTVITLSACDTVERLGLSVAIPRGAAVRQCFRVPGRSAFSFACRIVDVADGFQRRGLAAPVTSLSVKIENLFVPIERNLPLAQRVVDDANIIKNVGCDASLPQQTTKPEALVVIRQRLLVLAHQAINSADVILYDGLGVAVTTSPVEVQGKFVVIERSL